MNEGVVSKETVVLRRWGSSIQKFGFINGVDNVNWPPYRDSVRWPIYIINSVDKTKFLYKNRYVSFLRKQNILLQIIPGIPDFCLNLSFILHLPVHPRFLEKWYIH